MNARVGVFCPAPISGSGGIRTIELYAYALVVAGFEVTLITLFDGGDRRAALEHSSREGVPRVLWPCELSHFDCLIATRWDTAAIVRDSGCKVRGYLVQDFEASFVPVSDGYLFAENSFLYGLRPIVLGRWLFQKLSIEYGLAGAVVDFGVDLDQYKGMVRYDSRSPKVCALVQTDKPRRCSRVVIEALGIVKAQRPDVDIVIFGGDPVDLWFGADQVGIVPRPILAELYNSSTVGLCISSTNPSRIPFEMMACGLPVVDLYRENNLYDYDGRGVLLAHQTPESIAKAVLMILERPDFGLELSLGGMAEVALRPESEETASFARCVEVLLSGRDWARPSIEVTYLRDPVIAEVYSNDIVKTHCAMQRRSLRL